MPMTWPSDTSDLVAWDTGGILTEKPVLPCPPAPAWALSSCALRHQTTLCARPVKQEAGENILSAREFFEKDKV